ncbi:MAG: hypothetical protein NC517_01400 [Firmicutes bacterium]|nr:hypothetical protein [Bacillota bacterium]
MYEILDFIDSPEVRKHNEEAVFTPAQQAVLIMRSGQKGLEEKLDALQYLTDHYTEEEFDSTGVFRDNNKPVTDENMREITMKNIAYYRRLLAKRYDSADCVFAAALFEQDSDDRNKVDLADCYFRADYESALRKLREEKAEYEDSDELRDLPLWAEIVRIPLKKGHEEFWTYYRYNHDLVLMEAEGRFSYEPEDYTVGEVVQGWYEDDLGEAFGVHISAPFRPGDLVKSVSFRNLPTYGVIHGNWRDTDKEEEWWEWQDGVMGVRLDISWDGDKFGWDHDFSVLSLSYCDGEEIPHDNRMIKLVAAMRKKELDIVDVLRGMTLGGPEDLDELVELVQRMENRPQQL